MTTGGESLRIGTTERTAALHALDEHLAAGRLDVDEYGDRSAKAASATTADELSRLFADLPAPHPALPGQQAPDQATAGAVSAAAAAPQATVAGRAGGFLSDWPTRIVAVTPLVAVALFFITGSWLWFLIIPAAGALVYGAGGSRDRDRDRAGRDRDRY